MAREKPVFYGMLKQAACLGIVLLWANLPAKAQAIPGMPRLVKTGGTAHMEVNGQPFLILGGEPGNSSASDMAYMRPLWPRFDAMQLNTVLSPVYWELLEPQQG